MSLDPKRPIKLGPSAVLAAVATGVLLCAPAGALAAAPSTVIDLTSSSVNASKSSVGVASNGTRTVTWVQNLGPIAEPTGYAIRGLRVSTKIVRVTTGTGKKRRTVNKAIEVKTPLAIVSESGKTVRDAVSSTASNGTTTVAWSSLDENGTSVTVRAIRITPTGRVGAPIELAAAGSRIRYLQIRSSANGVTTVVWRRDDSLKSWIEARRIDAAGLPGQTLDLTPDHGAHFDPRVAVRPNGSADVVWRREGVSRAVMQVRQIGPTGELGEIIDISNPDRPAAEEPVITMAPNGRSNIVWTEWTGSAYAMRLVRLDSTGARGRYVEVASQPTSPSPSVGVDSAGTATVCWTYRNRAGQFKLRLKRFSATYRAGALVDFGPAGKDSLVEGFGPTMTVAPSGMTTVVWSAVQGTAFPPQVYLQGVRIDVKGGRGATSTIVSPGRAGSVPDLLHYPTASVGGDGTAAIAFTRQKAVTGSPALLKLIAWK
ncbi:MAG: hypothetical protein WCO96_04645 [Actinomycetes bacterium]